MLIPMNCYGDCQRTFLARRNEADAPHSDAKYSGASPFAEVTRTFFYFSTFCSLAAIGVFCISPQFFGKLTSLPPFALYMVLIGVLFRSASLCFVIASQFEYRYKLVFALEAGMFLLQSVGSLAICSAVTSEAASLGAVRLLTYFASFGVQFVVAWVLLHRGGRNAPVGVAGQSDTPPARSASGRSAARYLADFAGIAKFCLPLVPAAVANYILAQSDRLVIDYFCGRSATAMYTVAYNVSQVAAMVSNSLATAVIPGLFKKFAARDFKGAVRSALPVAAVSLAGVIVLSVFAPLIIRLFAPPRYAEALPAVLPAAFSVFFQIIVLLCNCALTYFGRGVFVMLSGLGAAGLNIALNMICVPKYGYVAAGWTTLVCYALLAAATAAATTAIKAGALPD